MNFKITSLIFFSLIIVLSFIFLLNYYPPIFSNLFEINSDINHLNYFTLRPYLLLTQIYISLTLFFYFQRIKYTDLLVYIYIFFSLLILTMGNVNHPHGDEAHRLINAHSLGYDFDFDLTNNYKEELFKYMVPDRHTVLINGKEFPVHWPSVAIYLFIPSFISSILNFDPLLYIGIIRVFDIAIYSIGVLYLYKSFKIYFNQKYSLFFLIVIIFSWSTLIYSVSNNPENFAFTAISLLVYRFLKNSNFEFLDQIIIIFLSTLHMRYFFGAFILEIFYITFYIYKKQNKKKLFYLFITYIIFEFIFFKLKGLLYPTNQLNIPHYLNSVKINLDLIIQYFIGYLLDVKEGYFNLFPLIGLMFISILNNFKTNSKLILLSFVIIFPNLFLISFANYMYAGLYAGGRFIVHTLPPIFLLTSLFFQDFDKFSFQKKIYIIFILSPCIILILLSSLNAIISDSFAVSDHNFSSLSELLPRIIIWGVDNNDSYISSQLYKYLFPVILLFLPFLFYNKKLKKINVFIVTVIILFVLLHTNKEKTILVDKQITLNQKNKIYEKFLPFTDTSNYKLTINYDTSIFNNIKCSILLLNGRIYSTKNIVLKGSEDNFSIKFKDSQPIARKLSCIVNETVNHFKINNVILYKEKKIDFI